MQAEMCQRIESVVDRMWIRGVGLRAVLGLASGLLAASIAMWVLNVVAGGWARGSAADSPWILAGIALSVGASVFAVGFRTRLQTARTLDRELDLKDRVVSALEFGRRSQRSRIHELQIADAAKHVQAVSAATMLPWRWRRDAALLAGAALIWGAGSWGRAPSKPIAVTPPPALPVVQQQAALLTKEFEALADRADRDGNAEHAAMMRALQAKAQSMADPGVRIEDALASMGRMRSTLMQAAAGLDIRMNDALWQAYANALQSIPHTQPVGDALAREDYREAADQLQRLAERADDPQTPFHQEAQGLQQPAAQLARDAGQAGSNQLEESLQKLSEGIRQQNAGTCRSALNQQASECRNQAARKSLADNLQQQLRQLAQCRQAVADSRESAVAQSGASASPAAGGGEGQNWDARGTDPTSTSGSQSAGLGEHGDPFGKTSEMATIREEKHVPGAVNRGPSAFTIEQGPAFEQSAQRDYAEAYSRYRKLSEEVLEQEALPAGYQAIIKRYFEGIRPRRVDTATAEADVPPPESSRPL